MEKFHTLTLADPRFVPQILTVDPPAVLPVRPSKIQVISHYREVAEVICSRSSRGIEVERLTVADG